MTAGTIAKQLWWRNQEFYPVDIIPSLFSMLIYQVGMKNKPLVAAVKRRNLTPSTL
jgi:hypothetical protein